jgi:hypothetical protein
VEIGPYREDGVVIRAGLKPGEMVVTAGVHKLTAGQKVRPYEGAPLPEDASKLAPASPPPGAPAKNSSAPTARAAWHG